MTLTCAGLDHHFDVGSASAELDDFLCRALASLAADVVPVVRYHAEAEPDGSVSAWVDDLEIVRGSPTSAIAHLMSAINVAATRSLTHLPILHASAVAVGGHAVVIPAAPGSGKSTLCAALLAQGATYLTDEAVPVDPKGRAIPYAKPIVVGPGSWPSLPEWRGLTAKLPSQPLDAWYLDPRRRGTRIEPDPILIRAIVLPRYRADRRTTWERISRGEATAAMASNTFNLSEHGRDAIQRFADVSAHAPAWRIEYGEVGEACDTIRALVGAG